MSRNKLFKELNLSHKPKRNGYDLSRRVRFTSKAGELLPITHFTVMNGDHVKMQIKTFTRTSPLSSTAMTQLREYVDVFFVPYRLLYRNSGQVLTQNQKNPEFSASAYTNSVVPERMPYMNFHGFYGVNDVVNGAAPTIIQKLSGLTNEFGLNRGALSMKLMNHLGYGYMTAEQFKNLYPTDSPVVSYYPFSRMPQEVSVLPLLAYQKIYYDFFRNTQWENNQPYNYNVDYLTGSSTQLVFDTTTNPNGFWDNPTMFDLRYSNYPKDLFFGLMPESQDGDPAEVGVDNNFSKGIIQDLYVTAGSTEVKVSATQVQPVGESINSLGIYGLVPGDETQLIANSPLKVTLDGLKSKFTVLEQRKAIFLQKYKEILGSGDQDYKARIKKIFGEDIPDNLAFHCLYLGGSSSDIKINQVENTNLINDEPATLRGNAVGQNNGEFINFKVPEAGIIMAIYHNQPVIDYSLNAVHFDVTKVYADDFANPLFDQLGFQELPYYYLMVDKLGDVSLSSPHIGYTTRYFDYKTGVDMTLGDFRETRPEWLAPLNMNYLKNFITINNGVGSFDLNANFFKVNPSILDPIFMLKVGSGELGSYVDTDQFLTSADVQINAVRPLDYYGVPY